MDREVLSFRPSERSSPSGRPIPTTAVAELRDSRYDGMNVRDSARWAGVATTTAFTYAVARDHPPPRCSGGG
jgi:hypothetical protein